MSKNVARPIIQFDRGLEEIYNWSDAEISLPASASFGPAQIEFSDQIEATLSPPNIEDFLHLSLMPDIERGLLSPHQFHDTLDEVVRVLRGCNDGLGVAAVIDLVDNDCSLRDLLLYFRNALIQG